MLITLGRTACQGYPARPVGQVVDEREPAPRRKRRSPAASIAHGFSVASIRGEGATRTALFGVDAGWRELRLRDVVLGRLPAPGSDRDDASRPSDRKSCEEADPSRNIKRLGGVLFDNYGPGNSRTSNHSVGISSCWMAKCLPSACDKPPASTFTLVRKPSR